MYNYLDFTLVKMKGSKEKMTLGGSGVVRMFPKSFNMKPFGFLKMQRGNEQRGIGTQECLPSSHTPPCSKFLILKMKLMVN